MILPKSCSSDALNSSSNGGTSHEQKPQWVLRRKNASIGCRSAAVINTHILSLIGLLSRLDYCNSLFVYSSQTTLRLSSSPSASCCCQTSSCRVSSDTRAASTEAAPLAASAKPNTAQITHADVRRPIWHRLKHLTELRQRCYNSRLRSRARGNFALRVADKAFSVAGVRTT